MGRAPNIRTGCRVFDLNRSESLGGWLFNACGACAVVVALPMVAAGHVSRLDRLGAVGLADIGRA